MKALELIFLTEEGKTTRMSIDNPQEPVDPDQVKMAMQALIESNVFLDTNGNIYASAKGSRLIERTITVYEFD